MENLFFNNKRTVFGSLLRTIGGRWEGVVGVPCLFYIKLLFLYLNYLDFDIIDIILEQTGSIYFNNESGILTYYGLKYIHTIGILP